MKSKINDTPKFDYPYLGIINQNDSILIVLFNRKNSGIVIYSKNQPYSLGCYDINWNEYTFSPFTGSVSLSN